MANILISAIVALVGLVWVFVIGSLALVPILLAFGGSIWLLYAIIREATRPRTS